MSPVTNRTPSTAPVPAGQPGAVRRSAGGARGAQADGVNIAEPGDRDLSDSAGSRRLTMRRVKDLAFWSRQMLILIRSGMPLADALAAIERQVPPGSWKNVLISVHQSVEQGSPLVEALAAHPEHFDAISRGLVAAGESSGQLDVMLERLSTLTRQQLRLRRGLAGAMVYPCLLIVIAIAVVAVMLLLVLPRFTGLFESMEVPLPPTTVFLIALSDWLRVYWWAVIVAAVSGAASFKLLGTMPTGRRRLDGWVLKLPYLGRIKQALETSRIARLMGVLLESKVPILEAILLTRQATGNVLYADLLADAHALVSRGDSLSAALARGDLVDSSICEAIHHGERSGQTGEVLTNLADFMDEDNETIVKTLTSILEPVILIVLGGVVAFIALSLFVPLFDLTAMAQGG